MSKKLHIHSKDCSAYLMTEIKLGAVGETRTRTALGHYPLKIACLPIPPRRHL